QGPKGDKGDKGDAGMSEIAYLRDQKAPGVNGGTCAAGSWHQRVLNVLAGDVSFITLNNNQFTLAPGKYFIEVHAPSYGASHHKAKLKVIETNQDVLIGSTATSHASAPTSSHSIISGEIIVSATSTFEVQHRC